MAYIPYTNIIPDNEYAKTAEIPLAFGGTVLEANEGVGAYLLNLDLLKLSAVTRKSLSRKSEIISDEGEIHSVVQQPFCSRVVMHIGTSLYTYSCSDAEFVKLEGDLPDMKSIMVHFMSCIYIYCDYRIFKLDDSFNLTECEAYAPIMFDDTSPTAPDISKMLDVAINMISPKIRVRYKETTIMHAKFPLEPDFTRPIRVFNADTELSEEEYTISETRVTLSNGLDTNRIELEYFVKNHDDIGYDDSFYGCVVVNTFGGAVGGGTRIFFTGNETKKGYYYKSELQNPLFVPSDEYEVIGDGCENVTALIKMYGNLVILTEKSVYLMSYTLNESGAVFSVKQLTDAVGCDIPDSVQLIDNRVVFCNSERGVYIIDSATDNGEHNIKPLGANILKGAGIGFLDNEKESLKNCKSADFDRKYYLFVGDRAYIWNYDESSFVDSGSYSTAQKRLIWQIYNGLISGLPCNFGNSLEIFSLSERAFYSFDGDSDNVNFLYRSEKCDFGKSDTRKYVNSLSIMLASEEQNEIDLTVIADEKEYYKRKINVCDKKLRIKIPLPKKQLYDFSVCLSGEGSVKLYSMSAEYMYLFK